MKLQVAIALACLIALIRIQPICCDERLSASLINKWTCTCSSPYQGNGSYALATNCSNSCDCSPAAGESSGGAWTCICDTNGFPKAVADVHVASCFRTCNCSSGSPSEPHASEKHLSSKFVVIILLLCVILTTFAFLASVLCYVRRTNKSPIQSPVFSSDKETSCNSATNLISHKSASEPKSNKRSPFNQISGCFRKASFLYRSKAGVIHETIIQFSYFDLENATNKFSDLNQIGLGGSSCVYRGQLKDGRIVAVKRFIGQGGPEADSDFLREIELLSRLNHCHVVPLLGYCSEHQGKNAERLLVFEYMHNGNLRDYLDGFSGKDMEWDTRVAIALGAARGLEYLHEAAKPRILHRDVKSTNILLDENWVAKITDLGMAKHLRTDGLPSCSSSPARMQGTFGYFAPEYAIVGRASLKSDVFSFGVVLLELITGRQPIHKLSNKSQESLVLWATPRLLDSKRVIAELPDPRLKQHFPEEEVQIMAYLAKECLLLDPDSRPTMTEVVQILSSIAPANFRRRNYPINVFQSSFTRAMRSESDMEQSQKQAEVTIDVEEFEWSTSNIWPARCSLPLSIDRTLCCENKGKEMGKVSAAYMERLIFLTSQPTSRHARDDEIVDLTEPRFESFHVTDFQSP